MINAQDINIVDVGIPVRSVNWVQSYPGRDKSGNPCIYVIMGQQADNLFVLQIDPETGAFRQFVADEPNSNYPTATFMSKTGRLYIGSAYSGRLLCFDPDVDSLVDLGEINHGNASFPCRIDEDNNGVLWIGSYGTADLTSYDTKSGQFTRYGRMDDVDMYNYPLANADGMIANLIRMTQPHVVVLDPKTGEKKTVGPVTTKGQGTIDIRRCEDGKIYIDSSDGKFRIDGMEAVKVDTIPPPMPVNRALSDGSTFAFSDSSEFIYRKIEIHKPNGEVKRYNLDYEASGSDIFYNHLGPDGCLYGSSILPLHLFRYNPNNSEMVDLGKCSNAGGEAYSMANLDGKIYISSYPGATISIYDPSKLYHFGTQPDDNPRDIGRIDDISYRPRATLSAGGRVWTASVPDYGMWGGPLSYYDPKTEEKKAYYRICGDASCYTLAFLSNLDLIAVGTSISGGSGTQPKVDQAVIFLWDYKAEKKLWEGTLDRPVSTFNALLTGVDGRLYGTAVGGAKAELFVFDPISRKFTDSITLPSGHPLDLGLQNAPDGKIYGFTSSCIYRLDPSTLSVEVLINGDFGIAGPIIGDNIYFSTGHHLKCARIF
jgi:streptogramin lyase